MWGNKKSQGKGKAGFRRQVSILGWEIETGFGSVV